MSADYTVSGRATLDVLNFIRNLDKSIAKLTETDKAVRKLDKDIKELSGKRVEVEVAADTKELEKLKAELLAVSKMNPKVKVDVDTKATDKVKKDLGVIEGLMKKLRDAGGGNAGLGILSMGQAAFSAAGSFLFAGGSAMMMVSGIAALVLAAAAAIGPILALAAAIAGPLILAMGGLAAFAGVAFGAIMGMSSQSAKYANQHKANAATNSAAWQKEQQALQAYAQKLQASLTAAQTKLNSYKATLAGLQAAHSNMQNAVADPLKSYGDISNTPVTPMNPQIVSNLIGLQSAYNDVVSIFGKNSLQAVFAQDQLTAAQTQYDAALKASIPTSDSIIATMRTRLATIKQFAADLTTLRGMGLNKNTLASIQQAGPEQGDALAKGLINGGGSAITTTNALQKSIDSVADSLGKTFADAAYGKQIAATSAKVNEQQKVVDGLTAKLKDANAAIAAHAKLQPQAAAGIQKTNDTFMGQQIILAALTPAQRKFYEGWQALKKELKDFSNALAPAVLDSIMAFFKIVGPILKPLAPVVQSVAKAMGVLADYILQMTKSADFAAFMKDMASSAGSFISQGGIAMINFFQGLMNLLMAFLPMGKTVGDSVTDMSKKFLTWSQHLDKNKGFQDFMKWVKENGPKIWNTIVDAIKAVIKIIWALRDAGMKVWGVIDKVAGWINGLDSKNPKLFKTLITDVGIFAALLGPVMIMLGGISKLMSPVIGGAKLFGSLAMAAGGHEFKDAKGTVKVGAAIGKKIGESGAFNRLKAAAKGDKGFMTAIGDGGSGKITSGLKKVGEAAKKHIGFVVEHLKTGTKWALEHGKSIATTAAHYAALGGKIAFALAKQLLLNAAGIAWKVIQATATALQWLWNVAMDANPIGLIVIAIAALIAGLVLFFTKTKIGREIWAKFVSFLKVAWLGFKAVFHVVIDAIVKAWNWLWPVLHKVIQVYIAVFKVYWKILSTAFRVVVDFIKDYWSTAWGIIKKVFHVIVDSITTYVKVWGKIFSAAFSFIGKLWNPLLTSFVHIANAIIRVWNATIGTIFNKKLQTFSITTDGKIYYGKPPAVAQTGTQLGQATGQVPKYTDTPKKTATPPGYVRPTASRGANVTISAPVTIHGVDPNNTESVKAVVKQAHDEMLSRLVTEMQGA